MRSSRWAIGLLFVFLVAFASLIFLKRSSSVESAPWSLRPPETPRERIRQGGEPVSSLGEVSRCAGFSVQSLEGFLSEITARQGLPASRELRWENAHLELTSGEQMRVRFVPSAETVSKRAQIFGVDSEGLPVPLEVPEALAGLGPLERYEALKSQGKVTRLQRALTLSYRGDATSRSRVLSLDLEEEHRQDEGDRVVTLEARFSDRTLHCEEGACLCE